MSPFREITVLQSQSQNLPSGQHGPVTDQRASFTRRFRAVRVRHASIGPKLSRPRGVGPKRRAVLEAPQKRVLSEAAITFKLQRGQIEIAMVVFETAI